MPIRNPRSEQTSDEDYPIGRNNVYEPALNRTPGKSPSTEDINSMLRDAIERGIQDRQKGGDNNGGSESKE